MLTAATGEEALTFFSRTHVDTLLLDYLMPAMKGDQLAETVRAQFPAARIETYDAAKQDSPLGHRGT